MLVHAYGQIFGFYRAHSQEMALHFHHLDDGGGYIYYYITTSSIILVPFTLLESLHRALFSLAIERAKEVLRQVCNVSAWLRPHRTFLPVSCSLRQSEALLLKQLEVEGRGGAGGVLLPRAFRIWGIRKGSLANCSTSTRSSLW